MKTKCWDFYLAPNQKKHSRRWQGQTKGEVGEFLATYTGDCRTCAQIKKKLVKQGVIEAT